MPDQASVILQCSLKDLTSNKKLSKPTYMENLNAQAPCEITGLRDSTENDSNCRAPGQQPSAVKFHNQHIP